MATFHGRTLVGPFPGQPQNGSGLYARNSPKTGELVLFHWDAQSNQRSRYATTPTRALELKDTRSKKQHSDWYGFAKT